MSLVAEALANAGALTKATLDEQVGSLERRVLEICQLIRQQYVEFFPGLLVSARDLNVKIDKLSTDIDQDAVRIRSQLHNQAPVGISRDQIRKLEEKIKDTEECILAISDLAKIADLLEEIDVISSAEQPLHLANLLQQCSSKIDTLFLDNDQHISSAVSNSSTKGSSAFGSATSTIGTTSVGGSPSLIDPRVIPALREELIIHKERLIYELTDWWGSMVRWILEQEGESEGCILQVALRPDANDACCELVARKLAAMRALRVLDPKVAHFARCLMDYFCRPILQAINPPEITVEETDLVSSSRGVRIILRFPAESTVTRGPDATGEVFGELTNLFDVLHQIFGSVVLPEAKLTPAVEFLTLVGAEMGDSLLKSVVSDCLKPAVPFEKEGNQKFQAVLEKANRFESLLKEINLLPNDVRSFEEFAQKSDSLFMDRRCQKILEEARDLIMSDLHNLEEVGKSLDPSIPSGSVSGLMVTEEELDLRRHLDALPDSGKKSTKERRLEIEQRLPPLFQFPKCKISCSVFELVNLLDRTLEEACNSGSQKYAARLLETARNLLELYIDITPLHHEDKLRDLPQVAAAFYNDCYYVAHRLMTLGWEVTPRLAPVIGLPSDSTKITFVDFVPRLRDMASACLETQLQARKRILDSVLKSAGGFTNLGQGKRLEACEKAFRGCALQMEQLQRVWKEVLTVTVLLKAVGSLVSYLLVNVVTQILRMEDIAADDASHIAMLMSNLLIAMERVLVVEKHSEIHRFCEGPYFRSKELIACLQGSLQDILDRWCDGKGPLALWLTPEEVRQLIRALFQNTERRAMVLKRIK